jgi:hypothetical protein
MSRDRLPEILDDWVDLDVACYLVGVELGIIPDYISFGGKAKWITQVRNPLRDAIYDLIMKLSEMKILEFDDEAMEVKWNPDFTLEKLHELS